MTIYYTHTYNRKSKKRRLTQNHGKSSASQHSCLMMIRSTVGSTFRQTPSKRSYSAWWPRCVALYFSLCEALGESTSSRWPTSPLIVNHPAQLLTNWKVRWLPYPKKRSRRKSGNLSEITVYTDLILEQSLNKSVTFSIPWFASFVRLAKHGGMSRRSLPCSPNFTRFCTLQNHTVHAVWWVPRSIRMGEQREPRAW